MDNKNIAVLVLFFIFIAAIVGVVMYMMGEVTTESNDGTQTQVQPTIINEEDNTVEPTIETTIAPEEDPTKSIDDSIIEIERGLEGLDVENDLPEVN